jgi:nitrogen fixation/metabolism regulation signal transduction histidine kinase
MNDLGDAYGRLSNDYKNLKAALAEKEAELAAARDDIETLKRWIESMKGAE